MTQGGAVNKFIHAMSRSINLPHDYVEVCSVTLWRCHLWLKLCCMNNSFIYYRNGTCSSSTLRATFALTYWIKFIYTLQNDAFLLCTWKRKYFTFEFKGNLFGSGWERNFWMTLNTWVFIYVYSIEILRTGNNILRRNMLWHLYSSYV